MKTRQIAPLTLIAVAGCIEESLAQNNARPNVVLIITDQQNVNKIAAMGDHRLTTPAFDYLIQNGYCFTQSYCVYPLSVPSRFSMFTGYYPSQFNINNNNCAPADVPKFMNGVPKEELLGALFAKAGYDTWYGGKTHLPGAANNPGQVKYYGFANFYSNETRAKLGLQAAELLNGLRNHPKPFFMVASFINPHDICQYDYFIGHPVNANEVNPNDKTLPMINIVARADSIERGGKALYESIFPPLPFNFQPIQPAPVMRMPGVYPTFPNPESDTLQWRKRSWTYDRIVEAADNEFKPLLDAFIRNRMFENTILVFVSDHGELNGAHQMERKMAPYEECQKVPFIFTGKGIRHHRDDINMANTGVDLMPTLCDLAGIKWPSALPGKSLKGLLTGKQTLLGRDFLFLEGGTKPKWYQVTYQDRTASPGHIYKYTVFAEGKPWPEMLVDIKNDPGEMKNVVGDANYAPMKSKLRSILQAELNSRGITNKN